MLTYKATMPSTAAAFTSFFGIVGMVLAVSKEYLITLSPEEIKIGKNGIDSNRVKNLVI